MGDLRQAVQLLHSAADRLSTLEATVRTWPHQGAHAAWERFQEWRRTAVEAAGGGMHTVRFVARGGGEPWPETSEEHGCLWVSRPGVFAWRTLASSRSSTTTTSSSNAGLSRTTRCTRGAPTKWRPPR